jgi:sarcosine oxidase
MPQPRIVVVGLGITGAAALMALARRGAEAIGIEQFEIGHDRGSSHGPTRIIRLAHFENPAYVPLMRRAYELWHELERLSDTAFLRITGMLEIGPADGAIVRGTMAAARNLALRPEVLEAAEVMRRYPAFRVPRDFVGLRQADGGYIEARAALDANITIAARSGARILANETVVGIEPRANGVIVTTAREKIAADGLVVCAGPWLRALLPELRLTPRITRQVVGWFEPEDAALFAVDRFPVFILDSVHGNHYGFPAYAGLGVKVAKHGHLEEIVEPDDYDRKVSAQDEAAIRAPFAEFLPSLDGRLLSAQTCLYTTAADDEFIVDTMPRHPHIVIASPCCGRGFKFSPVVGEIVADLITQGATRHDIAPFRLHRPSPS